MGLLETTFVITDDRYDSGCGLQEYRGDYSLCEAKKGDSKTFLKWVFPQKYDKDTKENYPGDKAFPMSIKVGSSKEEAIETLRRWLDILEDRPNTRKPQNGQGGQTVSNDNIPF